MAELNLLLKINKSITVSFEMIEFFSANSSWGVALQNYKILPVLC